MNSVSFGNLVSQRATIRASGLFGHATRSAKPSTSSSNRTFTCFVENRAPARLAFRNEPLWSSTKTPVGKGEKSMSGRMGELWGFEDAFLLRSCSGGVGAAKVCSRAGPPKRAPAESFRELDRKFRRSENRCFLLIENG